ncbi:MAG: hypothetical protein LQ343_006469 [Gyalolechia ehrenbergii]|nr:MAG: hypothetical protein LQ343_006469 [Gyalolechia ehrenbergii]
MATTAGYFDRKPTATSRPGLSHLQGDPASPHTPQRTFSSAFSSPALSYRAEEEVVVLELGARHLSAGIVGESNPRCRLDFGPERNRRVGDYRQYLPEYQDRPRKKRRNYKWGEDHELWRMNLREVNLGLVEDKVERVVREAYTKYLLLDSKNKRLVLVLPSLVPHRLLSSILSSIFSNFQTLSITLFSSPVLNVAAAGCRAGLVVDIGWEEAVITSVYELRDVRTQWTTRAMKVVTQQMAILLQEYAKLEGPGQQRRDSPQTQEDTAYDQPSPDSRYFEFSEEVTSRIAWCPVKGQGPSESEQGTNSAHIPEQPVTAEGGASEAHKQTQDHTTVSIPSPLPPHRTLQIPFAKLAEPVEDGLLAKGSNLHTHDDHEQPLPQLIYKTLLSLPPDVRSQCMARIIITGGGSNIAGLKTRLLNELKTIVKTRGWDPVYGKVAGEAKQHREAVRNSRLSTNATPSEGADTHLQPQVEDEITEKLQKEKLKSSKATAAGEIRGVETLGPWAGGSLVASLKVKGVVEIDRDSFLTNGLAGAKKESEVVHAAQRMSLGARSGLGEKTGWTLGAWA